MLVISKKEGGLLIYSQLSAEATEFPSVGFLKRLSFQSWPDSAKARSFARCVQVISLGFAGHDSSPISLSHLYVQNCILPLFNVFSEQRKGADSFDRTSTSALVKKLSEFNLSLIQCQQNVYIPEIRISVESSIKARAAEALKARRTLSVENCADLIEQPEFVDRLAQHVSKWIKDIQSVLNMKYDLTTGSTLNEIAFWRNLSSSLRNIETQLA